MAQVDGRSEKDAWFSEDGIPCEVLRFTANGWQKGKVRITWNFARRTLRMRMTTYQQALSMS
jgi:hypothetical protein